MNIKLINKYKKTNMTNEEKYTGEAKGETTQINYFLYNKTSGKWGDYLKEENSIIPNDDDILWINVTGLYETNKIKKLCEKFEIDQLTIEDIYHTNQRNKIEIHDNYSFIVLKLINKKEEIYTYEQFSIIYKDNLIITFNETENKNHETIKNQIEENKKKIKEKKSDYLMYAILDKIIDDYFIINNELTEKLEKIDESVNMDPDQQDLIKIKSTKQEVIYFKKNIMTLKETLMFNKDDFFKRLNKENKEYYRDLFDHVYQLYESADILNETLTNLTEIYFSAISYKMNEIMKVLTIISTIFIPLSFLAGLYGMNFKNMPELDWNFGYPLLIIIMLLIVLIMLLIFKKKKWF